MNSILDNDSYINSKVLPKEYLILKLRMIFNEELFDKEIISFDTYNRMQTLLIKKMNKILLILEE